ncbi:MAG TPA: methyltransferase, partial [Kofleriaceae bacterium]|nr:methyltransferase [Kofleriaceae bacterium]
TELDALAPALATCQLWYCEAATSGLTPAAQLGVLAAAVGAARRLGVDVARPWHAQLRPLVARLHGDGAAVRYRTRLVEAALGAAPIRALVTGTASTGPLGALSARLAHPTDPDAIVIDYLDTDESAALVTLLGLYETRSQAAFHTMLKALCDLYGLRKDDFDRVANEANYLATMNAARSDKARMLDFVRPGKIVEIGPGGGVVLDLLEERFPDSEVIGLDLSREAIAALEQRARAGRRRWRVVLGAAEELARHVPAPVDTVVFCSILHEVYSYSEPRFALESVRHVVAAAFAALRPGGRLVIRDGVMPPPGTRRVRMLAPDVRPTLALYAEQFEGRPIRFTELGPHRVEMTAADAMEFLYTYTWGPASFPYEVRELYGILTYDDYAARLVEWCGGEAAARIVDNPLRSYLQDGYAAALAGKIELTDEHDRPVPLPDSNCLLVVERR